MSVFESFSSLKDFTGTTRLFPLPDLVMFPHVLQPLHVFESRYCDLLKDALSKDRLIAMAMLAPGWEKDYEGRPPLQPMACLGQVVTHRRLKGGSHNVLLLGLRRIRLTEELAPVKSFREAAVELCEDYYPPSGTSGRAALQNRLGEALLRVLPTLPQGQEQIDQILSGDLPLGVLTDIVSYMLDIDLLEKERLLAELNVDRRAELLLTHLSAAAAVGEPGDAGVIGFPPRFSPN
jgi:uncharacterized protein